VTRYATSPETHGLGRVLDEIEVAHDRVLERRRRRPRRTLDEIAAVSAAFAALRAAAGLLGPGREATGTRD
jgi:hypothetical protein